jgi:hypothetical protein
MIMFGLAAAGAVVGFVWQKCRPRNKDKDDASPDVAEKRPLHIVISGGRRAFMSSLVLLRTATVHSFKRTATHYAPVPLTFSAAVLSNLPAIFGTAFSINYVVVNGISLSHVLWKSRKGRNRAEHAEPSGTARNLLLSARNSVRYVSSLPFVSPSSHHN